VSLLRIMFLEFTSWPAFVMFMLGGILLMTLISLGMIWAKAQQKGKKAIESLLIEN